MIEKLSLLCLVGLHKWRSSGLDDWENTGVNFRCIRCGKGVKRVEDAIFHWPRSRRTAGEAADMAGGQDSGKEK